MKGINVNIERLSLTLYNTKLNDEGFKCIYLRILEMPNLQEFKLINSYEKYNM